MSFLLVWLTKSLQDSLQFFCKTAIGEHLQDILVQWLSFFGKATYTPTQNDASTLSDPYVEYHARLQEKNRLPSVSIDLLWMKCLYRNDVVTPNLHMHCHLRACIEDLGPIAGIFVLCIWTLQWSTYLVMLLTTIVPLKHSSCIVLLSTIQSALSLSLLNLARSLNHFLKTY